MKTYRLSQAARSDIIDILAWTHATFGGNARKRYEKLLATALRDIAQNPFRSGTSLRPEIADELHTYHLRYSRERQEVRTPSSKTQDICCSIAF